MAKRKGTLKICSRGHKFYKSSDRPVCPICWKGYYRKKAQGDFPNVGAPALRALKRARIGKLAGLKKYTEEELLALHGIGPRGLKILRGEMRRRGFAFARPRK